jgi:hypothetical protein
MKYLWILLLLAGVWMLASAATAEGLLPSGHGVGRWSEVVLGLACVLYGGWRLRSAFTVAGRK